MHIKCLIIEDEPLATYILNKYIKETPFLKTASTLESLSHAAEIIQRQKPEIVFLDINTGDVNKYQIQQLINRKDILLIFTTAYPKDFITDKLQIDLTGLGYLHKPIGYNDFVQELARMI